MSDNVLVWNGTVAPAEPVPRESLDERDRVADPDPARLGDGGMDPERQGLRRLDAAPVARERL